MEAKNLKATVLLIAFLIVIGMLAIGQHASKQRHKAAPIKQAELSGSTAPVLPISKEPATRPGFFFYHLSNLVPFRAECG